VFWALFKRRWNVLPLLIFFVPYMLIHTAYGFSDARYYTSVHWIGLLMSWYGIAGIWELAAAKNKLPAWTIAAGQTCILVLGVICFLTLLGWLPELSAISPVSTPLPYAAIGTMVLMVVVHTYIYRGRRFWPGLVTLAVMSVVIVSNQVVVARVLEKGQRDGEFRKLLDWYRENARPGEKLISTLAGSMAALAQQYKDVFLGMIKADNPQDFIEKCYAQGITYIAWDSRMGLFPKDIFYKSCRYDNIRMLQRPQSVGDYEYITTIAHDTVGWRYINVFRLRPPPRAHDVNSVSRFLP